MDCSTHKNYLQVMELPIVVQLYELPEGVINLTGAVLVDSIALDFLLADFVP